MSDHDVQIKISTVAELSALRDLEKELQKAVVAAKAMGDTKLAGEKMEELRGIQAQLAQFSLGDKFEGAIKGMIEKIPVLGEAVGALNGSFGLLAKGAAAAGAALELAKKSVEAFAEKESEVAKLNQALANSGQYSEEASSQVQELADKFEKLTGLDDAKFITVARTLLQFGADRSNLEKYTQGVVDLAGLLGGDVEQAAFLFGKAMQGSTEMLGRYGIQIDKNLSQTEQLDQLMRKAAELGGGQLAASQGTLSRGFDDLVHATGKWFVGLGSLIAQAGFLQKSLGILADMVRVFSFSDQVKPAKDFQNSLDGIAESAEQTAARLAAAKSAGDALAALTLDAMAASADAAKTKFDELTASIRAAEQAQIAISQAQTAIDLANIDEAEKSGKITATQAAQQRFDARKAGAEREVLAKIDSLQAQMKTNSDRAEQAGFDTAVARTNVNQTQNRIVGGESQAADLQGGIDANKEQRRQEIDAQKAALAAAEAEVKRLSVAAAAAKGGGGTAAGLEEAQAKVAKTKEEITASDEAYVEKQKALRDQLNDTTAEIEKQREALVKLQAALDAREKTEGQVKSQTSDANAALNRQLGTTTDVYALNRQTATVTQQDVIRTAAQKDAVAGTLDKIGAKEAPVFGAGAQNIGRAAASSGDTGLFDASKALNDAAKAANEGGATTQEAKALFDAAKTLEAALQKRNIESLAFKAQLAVLADQIKTLGKGI